MTRKRTPAGAKLTELILEVLRLRGSMERHGAALTQPHGQTPARWQVMAAVWGDERTVPQVARRMGLARQSVQRIANMLVADGLAEFRDNPDHKSSPVLQLTRRGLATIKAITDTQVRWSNDLAAGLSLRSLETTVRTLSALTELLDERA